MHMQINLAFIWSIDLAMLRFSKHCMRYEIVNTAGGYNLHGLCFALNLFAPVRMHEVDVGDNNK